MRGGTRRRLLGNQFRADPRVRIAPWWMAATSPRRPLGGTPHQRCTRA